MPSPWWSLSTLFLLPACIQAVTLDCAQIRDDGQLFNLEKLGGPKTVHWQQYKKTPPTVMNSTFTIDICQPLNDKDAKKNEKCPSGTRVCAKKWEYREEKEAYLESVIGIAGEYSTSRGSNRALDPKFTRLKGSAGNSDGKEGVIVELNGGKNPDERSGTPQKAIIEFICDKKVSGNEGFKNNGARDTLPTTTVIATPPALHSANDVPSVSATPDGRLRTRADDDEGPDLPDLDKGKNLQFVSYKAEGDTEVLRLRWKTKFACENAVENRAPTAGWGFFTWFIIILFLLVAAYIIFGSWLNYNRYGARGWDLIPHGDTIRDIPYLVKDFSNSMADRLKGQNSRGGYSAV